MNMKKIKLEVLMSCMNQNNFDLTKNMNLTTDILILNQTNENRYEEIIVNGNKQRMISIVQKGLSKSRNELLLNMNGDIGILCDDDVVYEKEYEKIILRAFDELRDADIIIFNFNRKNSKIIHRKVMTKLRKAPKYKNYASVQICFKKDSFYKNNLFFNINFGSGSKYFAGEESLLLREANKKKLKIYEYPATILTVDDSTSTWFNGYNREFFYNKGAWLKAAYPKINFLLKWYFIFKFFNKCNLSIFKILKNINNGIKGYNLNLSFEEYEKLEKK